MGIADATHAGTRDLFVQPAALNQNKTVEMEDEGVARSEGNTGTYTVKRADVLRSTRNAEQSELGEEESGQLKPISRRNILRSRIEQALPGNSRCNEIGKATGVGLFFCGVGFSLLAIGFRLFDGDGSSIHPPESTDSPYGVSVDSGNQTSTLSPVASEGLNLTIRKTLVVCGLFCISLGGTQWFNVSP